MATYIGSKLKHDITISKLYSVHYFEYPKNYKFTGERHNFWELVYADKSDVTVYADEDVFTLKQSNVVFHKPNEWHSVHANSEAAANVAIISFACDSPAMRFFENKVLSVGQEQKAILSKIFSEYTNAFSTPLGDPDTKKLIRKKHRPLGAEQLICQYIAEFLISLLRQTPQSIQRPLIHINHESAQLRMLVNYMLDHIAENITIDELVKYSGSNKTTLAKLFKSNFHMSVMEYFIHLKIDLAKSYLREANYNVTQIAELLGYSGIHYFSRQFKNVTGMSPTEYSISIKSMVNTLN